MHRTFVPCISVGFLLYKLRSAPQPIEFTEFIVSF